jgi:hypothetical protein
MCNKFLAKKVTGGLIGWFMTTTRYRASDHIIRKYLSSIAIARGSTFHYTLIILIHIYLYTWASGEGGKGGSSPLADQGRPKIVCFWAFLEK